MKILGMEYDKNSEKHCLNLQFTGSSAEFYSLYLKNMQSVFTGISGVFMGYAHNYIWIRDKENDVCFEISPNNIKQVPIGHDRIVEAIDEPAVVYEEMYISAN